MADEQLKYRIEEIFRIMTQLVEQGKEQNQRLGNIETDISTLKTDVSEIKSVQKEHTKTLNRLDSKTDEIAGKIVDHEHRLTKAEQNIEDLQSNIH